MLFDVGTPIQVAGIRLFLAQKSSEKNGEVSGMCGGFFQEKKLFFLVRSEREKDSQGGANFFAFPENKKICALVAPWRFYLFRPLRMMPASVRLLALLALPCLFLSLLTASPASRL